MWIELNAANIGFGFYGRDGFGVAEGPEAHFGVVGAGSEQLGVDGVEIDAPATPLVLLELLHRRPRQSVPDSH